MDLVKRHVVLMEQGDDHLLCFRQSFGSGKVENALGRHRSGSEGKRGKGIECDRTRRLIDHVIREDLEILKGARDFLQHSAHVILAGH